MYKEVIVILLVFFSVITAANLVMLINQHAYQGKALVSETEGHVSISVPTYCGDGKCVGTKTCTNCPEDCGSCPSPQGQSPRGGGGSEVSSYTVIPTEIKAMAKQGEYYKTFIRIKNTGKMMLDFKLTLTKSPDGLVFLSLQQFELSPGQEQIVQLNFVSTNETIPDVYTGSLIVSAGSRKTVPIVFHVKSRIVLFDISLDIPSKYRDLYPGEQLLMQLTIFNLGDLPRSDVRVEYIIKDFEGNEIIRQSDTMAVETQMSFSKMIKLPDSIKPGDYEAIAQVLYKDSVGSSSLTFRVLEKETPLIKGSYLLIMLFILVLVLIIIIFFEYERRKLKKLERGQEKAMKKLTSFVRKKEKNK